MKPLNKFLLLIGLLFPGKEILAQELYVFTEPASNMPAHSLSFKLTGKFPNKAYSTEFKQRYIPEVMLGISKSWMIHLSGTFSNYNSDNLKWESVKGYLKWRFFSNDEVHKHFRMAAFAEGAYSRAPFYFDDMNLDGDTKGLQGGLIATQLLNKLALSSTLSYLRGLYKQNELHHPDQSLDNINYSLSAGYLLLPRNYTDYKQINLNLYCELLGMRSFSGHYSLDVAPALQFIFNSNTKLNIGARLQVKSNMSRLAEDTYLLSLEHTLLNVLKRKSHSNLN